MVAKITHPASIKRVLNYNEQKVKEGKAVCLHAGSFLKEAQGLNFNEKLTRFELQIALNQRASTKALHISLNFAEGESLPEETLKEIAKTYMWGIGFEAQPYLVYQHFDAGHPHLHIVTTNIRDNGTRISLHNLGKNQSSAVRKEIESRFGLQKAEAIHGEKQCIDPIGARKVVYGKVPTKRAITNVLDVVLPAYQFSSLPQLNAVLGLFNIRADEGKKESFLYQKGGLVYRILAANGTPVGVPVKASSIYSQPTLKKLEELFLIKKVEKEKYARSVSARLDWVLDSRPVNMEEFKQSLEKEKIMLVTRYNEQGILYGLTYIDLNHRCVFNGSELGKRYSANAIGQLITQAAAAETKDEKIVHQQPAGNVTFARHQVINKNIDGEMLFYNPIQPVEEGTQIPYELRKKKKKRGQKPS